jgi:predicted O-methyltransferase YrrM
MSEMTWQGPDRFTVGDTAFQALPPGASKHRELPREGEFLIFKPRPLVEFYAALVAQFQPRRVFELGIRMGGSTVFFTELARPETLVAIDRNPLEEVMDRIQAHAAHAGFSDVVRTFGGVDQADRPRLAEIVEDALDGAALDLVVDDCSHLCEQTRASFNELFPRLRPGGIYVIEDWRWAHTPLGEKPLEGMWPSQVPLTRLLFEIVLALPGIPNLITEISIERELALIRRGDASVDPGTFDVSAASNPRGQALLAPP